MFNLKENISDKIVITQGKNYVLIANTFVKKSKQK